jgi:L-lysine 2,3-aminomutase
MHFEVPEEKGKQLMSQLGALVPGYALPKYVREIPNQPQKTPII